jgi:hypothetical protein
LEYIQSDVIPPKTVKRKVAKKLRGEGLSGEKEGEVRRTPLFLGASHVDWQKKGEKTVTFAPSSLAPPTHTT